MKNYYDQELRALRHAAQKFAEQYPQQAALLNLNNVNDCDPYVERLLEGFAYLTARLQRRIDDDIPEFTGNVLKQLCPQLLQQMPAMTIVQMSWPAGMLANKYVIANNTQLCVETQENIQCHFRTIDDLELLPIQLCNAELGVVNEQSVLKLRFILDDSFDLKKHPINSISFYINAELQSAKLIYYFFRRMVTTIKWGYDEKEPKNRVDTMISPSYYIKPNLRVLLDYFNYPQKFYFLQIDNLTNMPWQLVKRSFELYFYGATTLLNNIEIGANNFLLHCVPAINLYSHDSEPMTIDHRRDHYPILCSANDTDNIEIVSVDHVVGIEALTGERRHYQPITSFREHHRDDHYFQVSPYDDQLSLSSKPKLGEEVVSCKLTVSNGDLPYRSLSQGMLMQFSDQVPAYIQATNVTQPTTRLMPPTKTSYLCNALTYVNARLSTLNNADQLKQLCQLCEWSDNHSNHLRINSIKDINIEHQDRFFQGALRHVVKVSITVAEQGFYSHADIFMFGEVFHQYFGAIAMLNTYVVTRIICQPSNKELVWQPELGQRKLI